MSEQWKEIPGFGWRYLVSTQGRVRSCDWTVMRPNRLGGPDIAHRRPGKLLTNVKKESGYYDVNLVSPDGLKKVMRVHRLVALTFLGPPPFEGAVINHKNLVKVDNRVSNLEWCSQTENVLHYCRDRWSRGLRVGPKTASR